MNAVMDADLMREALEFFQISVEGREGLEISVLPSPLPSRGTAKAMFLVTNRHRRRVLDLEATALPLQQVPGVRLGSVALRQRHLRPGEVTFGTVEIATEGAAPGDHGVRLDVVYRLAPAEPLHDAEEMPGPAREPRLPRVSEGLAEL